MAAPKIPTEHEEQREFVAWFRKTWPRVRILAIANGGPRNIAAAARLKAEGVSPGVPDLFIPAWRVWVEMKRKRGGVASAAQLEWSRYLKVAGYEVLFCMGADDAKEKIKKYAPLAVL